MKIVGKNILLTGAIGGMGRAFCNELGKAGARLGLIDIDEAGLAEFSQMLTANNIEHVSATADISNPHACKAAVESLANSLGGVDILMNNAGITHRSLFANTNIEVLRKVMEVNFWGSVYCTKYALPYLLQTKGMIVVTSSITGFTPLYGRTGYSASKYALHGFFESLRSEVSLQGIKVLMICPGFTDTGIASRALDGDGSITRRKWSTTGKIASPEEVAYAVRKAIESEKRLLVLSTVGKAAYWIGRLFPKFYEKRMRASVIHEFET
jgi:NAD(P)-dependent dehydrogenase (short-subunit alcohol dehydrogenase family)